MKRLLIVLLSLCLVTSLAACGGGGQTQGGAQPDGSNTAQDGGASEADDVAPGYGEGSAEMTEVELAEETALGESGLPVLPEGLTNEEILARYLAGTSVSAGADENALTAYEESLFYPQYAEGGRDFESYPHAALADDEGWSAYDPGGWVPGPDQQAEIEMDWSEFDEEMEAVGGAEGMEGMLNGVEGMDGLGDLSQFSNLPEKYAFLLPEGLQKGDMAMPDGDDFSLSLSNRSDADYQAIIGRLKAAGYTQGAEETNVMGMQLYEASNGAQSVTAMLMNGSIMISFST